MHGKDMKQMALLFIALAALLSTGCSSQSIVAGNIASMLVAFGLFFTTVNLRRS